MGRVCSGAVPPATSSVYLVPASLLAWSSLLEREDLGCPESEPSTHPLSQAGPSALEPPHVLVAIRQSVCVAPGSSLSGLVFLNQIQVQVPKVLLAQSPLV